MKQKAAIIVGSDLVTENLREIAKAAKTPDDKEALLRAASKVVDAVLAVKGLLPD